MMVICMAIIVKKPLFSTIPLNNYKSLMLAKEKKFLLFSRYLI
jgi:hypothetical protein